MTGTASTAVSTIGIVAEPTPAEIAADYASNFPFGVEAAVPNGEKTELVISRNNLLYLYHLPMGSGVFLGPATKARIDEIISNLQILRSVCTE